MAESRRKGIRLVIILCVAVAVAVAGILIWTSRRAKVTFASSNGGIDPISVAIGETIDQPKDPTPKDFGYSFGGWYADPNYVTEFDFDLPIKKDTTIYVKWVEKTFSVTILRATNTGAFHEVLWSSAAKYKSEVELPTKDTPTNYQDLANPKYNFQRANQNFLGFSRTDNGSGNFDIDYEPGKAVKMPAGGMTLYAIFRGESSQFIFNPNIGAEGDTKEKDAYFNEIFIVPNPEGLSKKYHKFVYWCTNADGKPRDASGNILPSYNDEECVNVYLPTQQIKVTWTEPLTLYAIWERNKVNVGLYNSGGTPDSEVNVVDAGLEGGYDLSNFTVPTKEGYRLIEYNTDPAGSGTSYAINGNIAVEETEIKLFAIWQRILTVGYTLNNNKVSDDELPATYADFEGIEGESFTILGKPASIELPNFEFMGWSLDPSATAAEYHANDVFTLYERDFVNSDKILLYGVWKGENRNLRFINTSDNTIQEITAPYGRLEKITFTPVYAGDSNYKFVGWGTNENYDYKHPDNYTGTIYTLGQLYEMGSNQKSGETYDVLYSLWSPESYAVTYYLQGGELAVAPGQDIYDKEYVYKEKVTLYSEATKAGYRFMGWGTSVTASTPTYFDTEDGKGYVIESMPGNSFPLYAIWSKEYTITFYNNHPDASGLVAPITKVILGETFKIPSEAVSNSLIRANYKVIAWSTKEEGGTEYAFDAEVTLEQSDMINFYAVWKGDLRTIKIYDGITHVADITGDYGSNISLALEEELDSADPGLEIGGFYMMLKTSPTADEKRYNFEYGGSISTTGMYFKDENGQAVETINVYIVWNAKYFNVIYELNGGIYNGDENDDMSGYRIYDQYQNQVQLELQEPTKDRYEFLGWTENPDAASPTLYQAGDMFTIPARDVTLYAFWARIYTISYNSNGGTLDPNETDLVPEQKSKGTVYNVKNNVYLKTNYSFKTWNSRADGQGENYALGTSFIVSTDITLYAIWQGQEVQVTLLASDPGDPSWTFTPVTISPFPRYGDVINLNSYASRIVPPNGLTLKGWSFNQPSVLDAPVDQVNDWTIDRVGNITLHAVWAPKTVYFVIGLAGGIYNNSYNDISKQVLFRSTVSFAEYSQGANAITKEGYRLIGFSYTLNAAVEDFAIDGTVTMPHETVKVYCMWKELAVFTFDPNCDDGSLQTVVVERIANDPLEGELNLAAVHAQFTRDNYTLVGWSTSASSTTPTPGFSAANSLFTVSSNADMYFYAIWEGRTILLTLNSNGSGGNRPPIEKKYGDVIDLSESQYILTHYDVGYNFGGWSTTSGENNNNGAVGTTYTVTTSSPTVDAVTLYAIWNKNYFNVTYNYGDSSLGKKNPPDGFDSQQVQYTTDINVKAYSEEAVKRLGYKFLGWAESKTESNTSKIYGVAVATGTAGSYNYTNLTLPMPAREVTLYALWEEILVPVIYKVDPKYNDTTKYPDFPRAQISWIGTGGTPSYTQQQLYQLSFKLPTNEIDTALGVRVTVPAYRFTGWIVEGDTRVRSAGEMLQVNTETSLTLLAQFEPNIITVVLNANGGIITEKSSSTASYSVRENSYFTLPQGADITRGSHRLVSYTVKTTVHALTTNPQTVQITSALIMDQDLDSNTVRITANWIRQITIHYNANGTFGESITGSIDDAVIDSGTTTPLPNCTASIGFQRPHYTFNGWNTEPDGSGYQYPAGTQYQNAEDITLYAQWLGEIKTLVFNYATNRAAGVTETITPQVNIYTVTSVRTDGSGTPIPIRYGDKISLTDFNGVDPTNSGWKLDGWTDTVWAGNATGWVTKYPQAATYTVEGDGSTINLYAVWTERSYQVYFNPNGGVFSDGTDSVKPGEVTTYTHKFTIPTAATFVTYNPDDTRYFYNFKGWSTNASFDYVEARDDVNHASTFLPKEVLEPTDDKLYKATKAGATYVDGFAMPNRDVTLYAVWEPIKITVVFYNDPTKLDSPSKTVEIQYGDTINLPSAGRYGDATVEVTLKDHNFDRWEHRDADKVTVIQRYVQQSPVKIFKDHMTETEQTMEKTNGTGTTVIVFVATWIPQTVYVQVSGNGGMFADGSGDETRFFESAVGRTFTAPLVNDDANKIVYVNKALVNYCTNSLGVGGFTFLPGEVITIPELDDPKIKEEVIEIDGEEVSTFVLHLYAQWVEAEAFIYYSDNEEENPYFATIGEAVASAKSGDSIKIIKDCYVKSVINIDKIITIGSFMNEFKIYRYIDPGETNTYTGKIFNITTTGTLISGEDAESLEEYGIVFDGGIPEDENSLSADEYYQPYFTVAGILRLYNGVVVQNCSAENGAAIYIAHNNAAAEIKYATIKHNFASNNGAGIYVDQASAINMLSVKFLDNVATNRGGAFYTKAQATIKTCLFERNMARNSSFGGGAVYNDAATVSEEGSIYNQNTTNGSGGAIYNAGITYIKNSVFTKNKAITSGGAVYNAKTTGSSDNMQVTGATFGDAADDTMGNISNNYGGGLTNQGRITISASTFANNTANHGGAMSTDDASSVTALKNTVFSSNKANNGSGGAVVVLAGIVGVGEAGVMSSTVNFVANTVNDGKGHAFALTGTGTVNIYAAKFTDHVYEGTAGDGGIVYQNQGALHIHSAEISNNIITNGYGGGLKISGGKCTVNDILITGNKAKYGGGIAVSGNGNIEIKDGEIYQNIAVYGGGIYIQDDNSKATLTYSGTEHAQIGTSVNPNTTIDADGESPAGGGIYNAGTLTISGAHIQSNISAGHGGGIYNASTGDIILVSGQIRNNVAKYNGGAIYCENNATVKFETLADVLMNIEGNLCGEGNYPDGNYTGSYYANGIYVSNTKVIISGYITVGLNGDGTILNDIFLSQRVGDLDKPTKIVEFSNTDSKAALNANTRICIASNVAIMGDKLVKFPSMAQATAQLPKFSFAGDDAGFRVKNEYLVLGNYAAVIIRSGVEVYYSTLTEAYMDAAEGENIIVYKNIKLSDDLAIFTEKTDLATQQTNLVAAAGVASPDITSTFYITKKVTFTAGSEYTIYRGYLEGDLFTIVGGGRLTLGEDSPKDGTMLIISGQPSKDDTVVPDDVGSLINVGVYVDSYFAGATEEVFQLTVNKGARLTKNKTAVGSAITSVGKVKLMGGEITGNTATHTDGGKGGAVYSSGYLYVTGAAKVTKNKAYYGGGIYIANSDVASVSLLIDSKTAEISSNEAEFAGGGIYVYSGKVRIKACLIEKNKAATTNMAGYGGGGIYITNGVDGTELTIASDSITNTTQTASIVIKENHSATNGGGIVLDNARLTFSNGYIQENMADAKGGGIALINSAGLETPATFFTTNNTGFQNYIINNEASTGGAIANLAGTVDLYHIKIYGNKAYSDGGAIYNEAIVNLNTNTNIGISGEGGSNEAGNDGGGIYNARLGTVESKTGTCYIAYNKASKFGGGAVNYGTFLFTKTLQFNNNSADSGAGIANIDSNAVITFQYSQFYANTARSREMGGGAIYNSGTINFVLGNGSPTIGGSAANANKAFNGGGIYNSGTMNFRRDPSVTTHHGLYVSYNEAEIYGGGIYNSGSINYYRHDLASQNWWIFALQNNKTTASRSGGGGGLCNNGGTINSLIFDPAITDPSYGGRSSWSTFLLQNNQTNGYGGGILLLDGTINAVYLEYNNNVAQIAGGGLAVISGTYIEGIREKNTYTASSRFVSNTAPLGDAIYTQVGLTFNARLTGTVGLYLANARSYITFNTYAGIETSTYYADDLDITVDSIIDGRRVAKFGMYNKMEDQDGDGVLDEVTVYHADDHFMKMQIVNNVDGWGLTVDEFGYVIISEPVAQLLDNGKKFATLAEAAAAADTDADIAILKSHTVTNQVLVVDKKIEFLCSTNIILTASKKIGTGSAMFLIFTTQTDLTGSRTSNYEVIFNPSKTNVSGSNWGAAAGVRLTLDGNRSQYKYNSGSVSAIQVRSGAYYEATQKPVQVVRWSTNYEYGANQAEVDAKGIRVNKQPIVYHKETYANGNSRNATTYGTKIHQQPAICSLTVHDTDIINFQSSYQGGINAILYTDKVKTSGSNSAIVTCKNVNFNNNRTTSYCDNGDGYTYGFSSNGAAALGVSGGRVSLENCTFTNNWACRTAGAVDLRFQQYNANKQDTPITIKNCIFTENKACGGRGGAIMINAVQGIVNISGTQFVKNEASEGAAIRYHSSTSTIFDVLNDKFKYPMKNHAGYSSEPYSHVEDTTYNANSYLLIETTCSFTSNLAKDVDFYGTYPATGGSGGAIYANNNLRVKGAVFTDNVAKTNGGAIYCARYAYFDGTTFNNNVATTGSGGAIYASGADIKYFNNVKANGNSCKEDGGALYLYGRSGTLSVIGTDTVFENNSAKRGGAIWYYRWYSSSAAQNESKVQVEIINGKFDNNSADTYGGAFYLDPRCNTAKSTGGTYVAQDLRNFIWNGVIISNNRAGQRGGGVYALYNLILYNVQIVDNEVYASSSNGGGAGVYCTGYLDVIRGTINSNKLTGAGASGMGGGGIKVENKLVLGRGYSTVDVAPDNNDKKRTIGENYAFSWEGTVYDWEDRTRTSDGARMYLVLNSPSNELLRIEENVCEDQETGLSNGQGTGVYAHSNIYFEGELGITDQIFFNNTMYLSSPHIYIKATIQFYYGGTPTEGKLAIERHEDNNLISSEISLMNINNPGWTFAWGSDDNVVFHKSTLNVAVYAAGWDSAGNKIADDAGAVCLDGRPIMNVSTSYGSNVKIIYDQVVPKLEGYTFYRFRYFQNNDVANNGVSNKYWNIEYNYSGTSTYFTESHLKSKIPGLVDGDELVLYVIWQATTHKMEIEKWTTTDYYSSRTEPNTTESGAFYYSYQMRTGESMEEALKDFEETTTTQPNAKHPEYRKQDLLGWELSYYMDTATKKIYSRSSVYPYPSTMRLRAYYVKKEYTLTFQVQENIGATLLTDKNVIKVKYGNNVTMLSGNLVSRAGYKVTGWEDNTGKKYNLNTNYNNITSNLTLVPVWQSIPFDLRVYYNYPTGGSSFLLYAVNAGDPLSTSLNKFAMTPEGYSLSGFATDAAGENRIASDATMPGENMILYAQWAPNTVTLKFYDINNVIVDAYTINCKYGEEYVLPDLPGSSTIKLWENLGSGVYYTPGSSFLINSEIDRYLMFYAVK